MKYKLRVSNSIEPFKEKALKIWGLEERLKGDYYSPTVFFGMYHLGDWQSFIRHRAKRVVFWAGSDILNLQRGYAFSESVLSHTFRQLPWRWIFRIFKADHYVENNVEQETLAQMGIKAKIVPSFLEDVNDFPINWKPHNGRPHIWMSMRPGREIEYGIEEAEYVAREFKDVFVHVYGIDDPRPKGVVMSPNLIYHGNVSPERFNEDIKYYHCGLRTNWFDGCSEIMAKSILLGQYPIIYIPYDGVWNYRSYQELSRQVKRLKLTKKPNYKLREHWLKKFNQFPFLW